MKEEKFDLLKLCKELDERANQYWSQASEETIWREIEKQLVRVRRDQRDDIFLYGDGSFYGFDREMELEYFCRIILDIGNNSTRLSTNLLRALHFYGKLEYIEYQKTPSPESFNEPPQPIIKRRHSAMF